MNPIFIQAGETKTILFHLNLKGKLYNKILNESECNILKCWWLKGPFGIKEDIGKLSNTGTIIDIKGLLWGKLKGSDCDSSTKIFITEHSNIAATFPNIPFY